MQGVPIGWLMAGIVVSSAVVINASERYSSAMDLAEIRVERAKKELGKIVKPPSTLPVRRAGISILSLMRDLANLPKEDIEVAHNRVFNDVGEQAWEDDVKPRFLYQLWKSAWKDGGATSLQDVLKWAEENPGPTHDLLTPPEKNQYWVSQAGSPNQWLSYDFSYTPPPPQTDFLAGLQSLKQSEPEAVMPEGTSTLPSLIDEYREVPVPRENESRLQQLRRLYMEREIQKFIQVRNLYRDEGFSKNEADRIMREILWDHLLWRSLNDSEKRALMSGLREGW